MQDTSTQKISMETKEHYNETQWTKISLPRPSYIKFKLNAQEELYQVLTDSPKIHTRNGEDEND